MKHPLLTLLLLGAAVAFTVPLIGALTSRVALEAHKHDTTGIPFQHDPLAQAAFNRQLKLHIRRQEITDALREHQDWIWRNYLERQHAEAKRQMDAERETKERLILESIK